MAPCFSCGPRPRPRFPGLWCSAPQPVEHRSLAPQAVSTEPTLVLSADWPLEPESHRPPPPEHLRLWCPGRWCSHVDGTRDSHTKWSKSKRERQTPHDIIYIWNLIYGTNEHIYTKETHELEEQTCGCRGVGERIDWEFGAHRCRLLNVEWISNVYSPQCCCIALGAVSSHLWWNTMEDNVRKRMSVYMYDWVTLLKHRNWQNTVNQL